MTRRLRTYRDLAGGDRSGLAEQVAEQRHRVAARLARVRHVVAVMSGKGGVGKSFVTAGLARTLARGGTRVGVLDADLYAPTAARMLAADTGPLAVRDDGVEPARGADGVRVISTDLLLAEGAPLRWREPDRDQFVWRGSLETGVLREFLSDVAWGELDVLLVDLPPGTDRVVALAGLVPRVSGAVAVTIASDASRRAVERALEAARAAGLATIGIVENMASYACEACGSTSPLFRGDAAAALARATGARVLGRIPFDPAAQAAGDGGRASPTGAAAAALAALADRLLEALEAP